MISDSADNSDKKREIQEKLVHLAFRRREESVRHHTSNQDLLQYQYLREGNMECIAEFRKMHSKGLVGNLSKDPLRNHQYLFVAGTALACRAVIDGGMESETAYGISDLYIQKADTCKSPAEVIELQAQLYLDYATRMRSIRKQPVTSVQLRRCMDYIDQRLHDKITVRMLAGVAGFTPSYLSTLFRKECGVCLSDYIQRKRVETAEDLLIFSDFTYAEIGNYLAFSSHSHFVSVFRKRTGYTPKDYRRLFYQRNWMP
ncbi:MAG: AraC family transcriptional regulator [Treponemataceae bacterium]